MRALYDVAKNYRDALLTATLPIVPMLNSPPATEHTGR